MTGIVLPFGWQPSAVRTPKLERWAPPLRRRQFWIVQALTIGIAVGHTVNERVPLVNLDGADFLPVSLYLIPVVYAGLTFGMHGAAPTAIWAFVLTLPNAVLWHEGTVALGELWQAGVVLGVGLFVGSRIERERAARQESELRERERRASEARYRGVFEVAADPILVLDGDHRILDANTAARGLLERGDALRGTYLDALCPTVCDAVWTSDSAVRSSTGGKTPVRRAGPFPIDRPAGRMWVEPVAVAFQDVEGQERILTQLRDVTPAVERQRLLEDFARRTVAAREEERRRVARDLHDGPLQSLVLLWRVLDAAEAAPDSRSGATLEDARRRTEDVADELRRFSRDLRPSVLDHLGLAAALKAEVAAFTERTGVAAWFESTGPRDRLATDVELTLLRICQEALRNIERHAGAAHARVTLRRRGDRYRMTVADDGIGVGPLPTAQQLVVQGRLGIVGMQERARLVGATCRMRRSSGWSTEVDVVGRLEAKRELTTVGGRP